MQILSEQEFPSPYSNRKRFTLRENLLALPPRSVLFIPDSDLGDVPDHTRRRAFQIAKRDGFKVTTRLTDDGLYIMRLPEPKASQDPKDAQQKTIRATTTD